MTRHSPVEDSSQGFVFADLWLPPVTSLGCCHKFTPCVTTVSSAHSLLMSHTQCNISPPLTRSTAPMRNRWGLEGWSEISDEGIKPGMDGKEGWGGGLGGSCNGKRGTKEKKTVGGKPNKAQSMAVGSQDLSRGEPESEAKRWKSQRAGRDMG